MHDAPIHMVLCLVVLLISSSFLFNSMQRRHLGGSCNFRFFFQTDGMVIIKEFIFFPCGLQVMILIVNYAHS